MQASGVGAGFEFFTNSSFMATFLLFYAFAVGMLALAVFISTLLTSSRTAQTVGYSCILIGFLLQFVITSAYAGILDLLFATDAAATVVVLRYALQLYPAFNFSKWCVGFPFQQRSALAAAPAPRPHPPLLPRLAGWLPPPPPPHPRRFYDISTLSASTVSASDGKLTRGPGFHWGDMFVTRSR